MEETMTDIFNICPKELALKDRFLEDIMAIFWSKYTSGTVFYMSYDADTSVPGNPSDISRASISAIERGLKDAFSLEAQAYFANRGVNIKTREIRKIKKAYSFTWSDMINGQPGQQVSMIL